MTISWGANTVHTFSSPAPVAPTFGAPAAAGASGSSINFGGPPLASPAFGATTPAPAFGAPAPAPAFGGSAFGTPAPPVGLYGSSSTLGGVFGSSTAPLGGVFASPAPAPGGSMFGASSAFGAPSSGGMYGSAYGASPALFGAPQQQQQPPRPQVPAQAALQAHMEAMNAAETQKIKAELSKLFAIYTGQVTPSADAQKNFVTIVYNDLDQEQRQLQWLHGVGANGQVMALAPPKPPQVSEDDWYKAVVQNPDPMSYMPVALVGADALSARLIWQQERASQLARDAATIQNSHETAKELYQQAYRRMDKIQRDHAQNRKRLLNIMRKVEVVRCMNLPLQAEEFGAMQQLRDMSLQVRDLQKQIVQLESQARVPRQIPEAFFKEVEVQDREGLSKMFTEHEEALKKLRTTLAKDARDVELIKQRVMPKE